MNQRIAISPVGPDRADDLFRLMDGLMAHEGLAPADAAAKERMRAELGSARPRFEACLAFEGGVAVGYASYFESFQSQTGLPTLHLDDLFVVESQRGNGAGQMLFDYVKALAHDRGFSTVDWLAHDSNEGALRFYQRNGAETFTDGLTWLSIATDS
ncbi:MAG: GNAT family N-acetyltransferase [Chloroflexi bacterium]|nr:GNAT family N-acetyltransferase [Chloroflexota bacterium]